MIPNGCEYNSPYSTSISSGLSRPLKPTNLKLTSQFRSVLGFVQALVSPNTVTLTRGTQWAAGEEVEAHLGGAGGACERPVGV